MYRTALHFSIPHLIAKLCEPAPSPAGSVSRRESVFRLAEDLGQAHTPALMFHVPYHTALDEQLHEPEYVGVFGHQLQSNQLVSLSWQ